MKDSDILKLSRDNVFASKACFEYTLLVVLKCGFLSQLDYTNLLFYHLLFDYVHS